MHTIRRLHVESVTQDLVPLLLPPEPFRLDFIVQYIVYSRENWARRQVRLYQPLLIANRCGKGARNVTTKLVR